MSAAHSFIYAWTDERGDGYGPDREFLIAFNVTDWGTAGYFDHDSGAAEAPRGPEIEIVEILEALPDGKFGAVDQDIIKAFQTEHFWEACEREAMENRK